MALSVKEFQSFKPSHTLGLKNTPCLERGEIESQTFSAGAVMIYSSGYLIEAGSDPSGIVGVALDPAKGLSTRGLGLQRCCPALPQVVFEGVLTNSSGGYSLAQTDEGAEYGIAKDATNGGWYVDQGDTGAKRVRIVGLKDAVGTTDGRVFFVFSRSAIWGQP